MGPEALPADPLRNQRLSKNPSTGEIFILEMNAPAAWSVTPTRWVQQWTAAIIPVLFPALKTVPMVTVSYTHLAAGSRGSADR